MLKKTPVITGYLILGLVAVCPAQQEEKLTITTYYPSPTGRYNTLWTKALGVGDTNADGSVTNADIPDPATKPGEVWIAGNVSIGTSISSAKLRVDTNVTNDGIALIKNPHWLKIMSGTVGDGSYNSIVRANDTALIYTNGTQGTGALVIAPWAAATSGIRIDGNGNVGIGTASPSSKLDLVSEYANTGSMGFLGLGQDVWFDGGTDGVFDFNNQGLAGGGTIFSWLNFASGTRSSILTMRNNGTVGIGTETPLTRLHVEYNDNTRSNGIYVRNPNTGAQAQGKVTVCQGNPEKCGVLAIDNNKFQLWSDDNIPLSFVTNNIEAILVRPNGRVGIGTASPDQRLHVVGNSKTSAVIAAQGDYYRNDWPSDWGGGLGTWDISCASVYYDGYAQRSDRRLKKDIVSAEASVVENLLKLRPVVYRWKDTARKGDRTHYGFIAQEVEEVFPELVLESSDENKTKSIATDELIAVLTKAVQEQQKRIDGMSKEIENLKARK